MGYCTIVLRFRKSFAEYAFNVNFTFPNVSFVDLNKGFLLAILAIVVVAEFKVLPPLLVNAHTPIYNLSY
jgi:hypothetical protein